MKKYQFVLSLAIILLLGLTSCKTPLQEKNVAAGTEVYVSNDKSPLQEVETNDSTLTGERPPDQPKEQPEEGKEEKTEETSKEETSTKESSFYTDVTADVFVTEVPYTKEQLLDLTELIVQGTIVQRKGSEDTRSKRITEYTMNVDKVYKGTYTEETLSVYTKEPLYYIGEEPFVGVPFELEVEKECVLLLRMIDGKYYPTMSECGYFTLNQEGDYANNGSTIVTLDPNTLAAEIAAVDNSSVVE